MVVAYFEPIFGASGDMILAAFVDAGLPLEYLVQVLQSVIPVPFSIEQKKVLEKGVSATRLKITIAEEKHFRGIEEIKDLLLSSNIKSSIISRAINAFENLAEVEAKIHGIDKKHVHFHELGAIDTIIDILGFFIALDYFNIERANIGKIPLGSGIIESSHGIMPAPAYATLELLKNFPVYGVDIEGENITPTAAALINQVSTFSYMPDMTIKKIGYGVGQRSFLKYRNMFRVILGEKDSLFTERILVVEFNVDDISAEMLGYFIDKVIKEGAKECFVVPLTGKKGRPAFLVTILCDIEDKEKICDIIFSETTTIGLRMRIEDRIVLKREEISKVTSVGKVRAKRAFFKDKVFVKPEFEDIKRIATERNMPLKEVYSIVHKELVEE